jgi:hypothetical protein
MAKRLPGWLYKWLNDHSRWSGECSAYISTDRQERMQQMCALARKWKQTCEVGKKNRGVAKEGRNKSKENEKNKVTPIYSAIHQRLVSKSRGLECAC